MRFSEIFNNQRGDFMIEQTQKKDYWLYIFGAMLCFGFIMPNQYLKIMIVAVVFYVSSFFGLCNPTLLLLVSGIVRNYEGNAVISLIATLPAYFNKDMLKQPMDVSQLIFCLLLLCVVLLSYAFGTQPHINTMIMFLIGLLVFLNVSGQPIENSEMEKYGLLGVIFVCFALFWSARTGGIEIINGRLAINDSIRELANAAATAEILLVFSFFNTEKSKGKAVKIIFLIAGAVILFLTLSKGALIAVAGTLFLLLLRSDISVSKKVLLALLFVVTVAVVMNYVGSSDDFRTDRLAEESNGFSGRTDIWTGYWQAMKKNPSTLIFGFGPGDIKRLGLSEYYSHSVILDVLFSYGICGFALFILMLLSVLLKCILSKNKLALAMAAFSLLLYATHGVSTATSFYILLGSAVALSVQEPKQLEENA